MRLTDFEGMEIINLVDASRLGFVVEVDADLDGVTGRIAGLTLSARKRGWWWGRRQSIPWSAVRRIGRDLIVVEIAPGKSS
ncbi:MAG: YlmC/YmxH family sporulation protein [Firmicutes bacterium]|nr:YlmC/YmxH family sporulation protein [Bacillota bacterium]